MPHKVQVWFTDQQWDLILKFKGELGHRDAEVVRNIVISFLSARSLIGAGLAGRAKGGKR